MGDASGTYASPTGSDLQNGGAGQRQGSDDSYENVSFQLDAGEQNSGQDNMRRASIGTMATHVGGAGTPTTAHAHSVTELTFLFFSAICTTLLTLNHVYKPVRNRYRS